MFFYALLQLPLMLIFSSHCGQRNREGEFQTPNQMPVID